MRNILVCLLFILSIYFVAGAESARDSPRRSRAPPPASPQAIDFDCPEEFGYYAHPTDCTQYYVCVFGGALLESCTGGLMYSHELQTCDWPRNVGCAPGATAQVQQQQVQQREPEIRSRGQSSRLLQQQQREPQRTVATKHDLYTEEEQLGPAEELESDRQQRVYRGQPSTIGQVASDRDAISTHSNAIPVPTGGREKLSVISFGTQQQYTRRTSGDIRLDKSDHNFLTNGPRKKRHTLLSQYQEARQPKFDGQPLSWSSYQPKVLYRLPLPPTPVVQPPIVQHTPIYHRRPQQPIKYKFNPSDARAINHQLQVNKPSAAIASLQQLGYQKRFSTTTRLPPQLIYRKRPSNIYFTTTPTYEVTSSRNKANNRNIQEKSTESSSKLISKERSEIQKNDSNNGEEEDDDDDDNNEDEEEGNKEREKTVENEATKSENYRENESEKSVSKQTTEHKDSKSSSEESPPKFPEPPDSFYRDSTYEDHNPFANHDFNFDKFLADLRNAAIDPTISTQRNPTTRSSHLYHANYAITNNPYRSNHQTTSASTSKSTISTNATTPKPNNRQSDEDYYDDYEDYDNRSTTLLLPPKVPKRLQELDNEEYEDESEEDYYDSEEDIDDSLEDDETEEEEEEEPSNQTENTQRPKLRIIVDQTTPQLIFHSSGLVTRCPPKKRCYDTVTTRKPYTEHVSTTERAQSQNIRPLINHISTHFPINYRHTITPNTSQPTPFTTSPSPPDLRKKLRQRLNKPGETDLRQEYKDKAHTQRTLTRLRASVTPAQQSYVDQQQNTVPSRGYNTSRYLPSQYDSPFYSLYDDDLYKDIGDFNQYNTQSNYRTQTYKEKKPQIEIVQQEPVQRGSTYSKSKYNTQSQDLYQSVTPQEYDTYSIQTNDDLPYRQTIQTKPSTRTNSRHRGSQTYTISPNEAETPNRGTPAATRSRPTLKPSTTVVGKAAEFIDIYRYPPRRPENVYPTPQVDKTAAKCRKDVCLLPDCSCGGKDIPGDLRLEETPQIVLLTFDDSVNDLNKGLYSDLFEKGRTNPNGCPISATFYVSHEWTDYSQVQNLYASGHEIASHSVSHSFGEQFTQRKWTREIAGQREIIAAYGGVKMEDVRGMRAPFLAIGGNKMFKMLYDSNFTYDSSMPVYENRPPSWPYTLDYKVFHDCMIPPCPTRSYPGVWEMPMVMWQDLNGGRCSMGDACSNPPTSEGVYKMLIKNFERHFTTNRSPFGLFYHAAWFTQPHHKEGFIAFLDTINKMPEVWLVTNWQAIQWVRDPTPISRLNNFAPFQCNYPDRPKKCNNPKVCNLWHKSGVRYMRTCQPCPDVYPWTGKSGVRNSRVDNEIINE